MSPMLTLFLDVLVPLGTGYFLRHSRRMTDGQCNILMQFNVIVLVTVMALSSFWILPLRSDLLLVLFLGIASSLLSGFLAARWFTRWLTNPLEQGAYIDAAMLSNAGTLGGICAFILYGEISFAYVQLFSVPQNMLMVLCCFPLSQLYRSRYEQKGVSSFHYPPLSSLLFTRKQLGVLGMIIGLLLQYFNVPRPGFVETGFHYLVHIQAWVAFVPVGYVIDFSRARFYLRKVVSLIPLRILTTLLLLLPAFLFSRDPVLLGTLVLSLASPVAINSVISSRLFQLDVDLAVAAFLLTTLVYVVIFFPLFSLFQA